MLGMRYRKAGPRNVSPPGVLEPRDGAAESGLGAGAHRIATGRLVERTNRIRGIWTRGLDAAS